MLWLDARQRSCLNATEPNYELVSVAGDRYPLTLESEQAITSYSLYKGRWGALRWPGDSAPVVAGSQRQLFAGLNRTGWFPALVGPADPLGQVSRLRAEAGLRLRVRGELAARGFVTPDGVGGRCRSGRRRIRPCKPGRNDPAAGFGRRPSTCRRGWFTRRRWLTRRGLNP